MHRLSALVVAIILTLTAGVGAAPVIDVGEHLLLPDTPDQMITIYVTGGDQVSGLNLHAQVADGGPELADFGAPAGTAGPAITGIDVRAGIFADAVAPNISQDVPQVISSFTYFDGQGVSVAADGVLATLEIDTTSFSSGMWDLRLSEVLDYSEFGGPYATDFAGTAASITNGTLTLIPEPTASVLFGLGGLILTPRRGRRPLKQAAAVLGYAGRIKRAGADPRRAGRPCSR